MRCIASPTRSAKGLTLTVIIAFVSAALFGSAVVIAKSGFRHVDAIAASAISIPSAALMFFLLMPWLLDTSQVSAHGAIIFALIGIFFPAAVTLFVFSGTDKLGATTANAISNTTPMFAILFAILFLGETLTLDRVLGAATVVAGVITLSWDEKSRKRDWPLWALLLPIGAASSRGGGLALTKFGLNVWPDPFAAVVIGYGVSASVLLLLNMVRAMRANVRPRLTAKAIPWFVATGWCNGAATLAMFSALKTGEVSLVSPIIATSPLFTLLLGALILRQERLSPRLGIGVALTVVGILLLLLPI
jgi:drug/metabolite transporter (DMT)-like permease